MKELREYQSQIVNKVIASEKDMLICLPTGSGKTFIAWSVIKALNEEGLTVVFVVPRLELIEQAVNEFGDVDVIWSDKTNLTGKKCVVASKDSLRTQYKCVPECSVLIFDEAHISLEQTFNLVQLIKPLRVLGLTATPERMDGKALLKGVDPLIDNIKDINTQEAFAGANRFASVLGMKFQCLRQTAKGFIKNE